MPLTRPASHDLPDNLVQDIKATILEVSSGAEVVLFGSYARGEAQPESDYDLLILAREPLTSLQKEALNNALYDLELQHGIVIAAIVFDRARWETPQYRVTPLHQHIDREGVIL